MSIDMYLPSLPVLEGYFHTDASYTQYTLASFFAAFALGQLLYGPLSDRFGRKRPLYAGLMLYVIASLGCVFAQSIEALIIWRFFQALGASSGVVVARAVVSDLFTANEAAGIYSSMMLVMGAAPMLAPMLGGYVMHYFDWPAIFWVLASFGVTALLMIHFRLQETHYLRAYSLAPKAIASNYLSLFQNKHFLGYALTGGASAAGMFAYIASSPFVFMDYFSLSAQNYGLLFGTNAFGFIAASQINVRLLKAMQARSIVSFVLVVQAVAAFILLAQAFLSESFWSVEIPLFIFIATLGFLMPNTTALAMAHFKAKAGSASAMLGAMQFAFAGSAALVVGIINAETSMPLALIMAFCSIVGSVIFFTVARR